MSRSHEKGLFVAIRHAGGVGGREGVRGVVKTMFTINFHPDATLGSCDVIRQSDTEERWFCKLE